MSNGFCLAAAIAYAKRGKPVFPLSGKIPFKSTHGFHDATTDEDKIYAAWELYYPGANIGIPTGTPSGFWVLDIDPRHGGPATLAALQAKYGPLPATLEAQTGGGGRHLYFALPNGQTIPRNSAGKLGPGLDIRGEGGYVAVPPSIHEETKKRYAWINKTKPVPAPDWLVQLVIEKSASAPGSEFFSSEAISEGQRNSELTKIAGAMRRRGCPRETIEIALLDVNTRRCTPPLPESEVRAIAQSVSRYEPAFAQETPQAESPKPFPFRTAAQIDQEICAEITWISQPYVAAGTITEVDGKVKLAGKSTWATHMCRAVLDGLPFMGLPTTKSSILYLTEQPPRSWRMTLERAGLIGRADFSYLYFKDIRGIAWSAVADASIAECKRIGARLLVVDTLSQFAGIIGDSENDAGEALRAMAPLQIAAGEGIAVMVIRHERKSGGDVSESGRGSSAFAGSADTVLSIRRRPGKGRNTLRVINAVGRLDDIPEEMVIDLTPTGYVALGNPDEVEDIETKRAILGYLPGSPDGAVDQTAIAEALELRRQTVEKALAELRTEGQIAVVGAGKRGDPWRYYKTSSNTSDSAVRPGKAVPSEKSAGTAFLGVNPSQNNEMSDSVPKYYPYRGTESKTGTESDEQKPSVDDDGWGKP